ncbi:MAG: phenylalanine--tRNA ligase subunit beta [Acidobacteriota bacterium]|nr:phenylalanine--tRNA ligase subunit beta [Acidobacteriota bacterium]
MNRSIPQLIESLDSIGLLVDNWEERDDDVILEIETYANRPDTLGHLGIARELAAVFGSTIKKQNWPLTEIEERTSENIDIQICDDKLCPRYCGIIVKDIEIGPSPLWLADKIKAMGLKPINNVVDASNYVLYSTAHPIHAFDLASVAGKKIIIRRAKNKEVLRSLEGENIQLSDTDIVIADEKKPIALAGIIGGEETSISEYTRDVFIESAVFNPASIRKSRKKAGIQTDASFRFERGADISFPPTAALMVASILTQMGGKATKGIMDIYPKPRKNKTVVLRNHRIAALLGVEIDDAFVEKILSSLEFEVSVQQKGIWQVKVPFFRIDIEREADLIEEIARFYGYDKIPSQLPPLTGLEPVINQKRKILSKLRQMLLSYGFNEVVNLSFSDPEKETKFKNSRERIKIRNPISSKASLLKTTLIAGLLDNISWNKNRGAEGICAFEVGNTYFWEGDSCIEQLNLALVASGNVGLTHWQTKTYETDFYHIKGTCETLMTHLRYEPFSFQEEDHPNYEEGQSLSLLFKGQRVGSLGLLKKEILDSFYLEGNIWAAEIALGTLLEKQPQNFQYTPVTRYPRVSRDISFIADRKVSYQEIKEVLENHSIPCLEKFELYDRFSGSSIPKGKISLSFRFVFRHFQRTLLAEEIDNIQKKIIKTLKDNFNFQLREGGEFDK